MNKKPIHIWLVIALLAAKTVWLFGSVAIAAVYSVQGEHFLRFMADYLPVLLLAFGYAIACVGLLLHKAWVRWLFLLPIAEASLPFLYLFPYTQLFFKSTADPVDKELNGLILGFATQRLVFAAIDIAVAMAVFRHFRRDRPAIQPRFRENGRP